MGAGADAKHDPALETADRLDAEGRHGEAIDVLAAAARRGNAAAKARIGARILLGDRAPLLGAQGAQLLHEAAAEGDAEAAAISAVLAAAGVWRPQDWNAALDLTLLAAERGSTRAQGALRALAGEGAGADWRRLRASVDLRTLLAPPIARVLHADPPIQNYADFIPPAIAAWLIERARGRLTRAAVYNAVRARNEPGEARTNSQASFGLLDTDVAQIALQARIAAAAGAPIGHLEAPAVLHYAPGEQFAEHFDFVDPNTPGHDAEIARNGQRTMTMLVYLNTDYEGGETEFPRLKFRHRGAAYEGLAFVNARPDGKGDVRTVHAGRPVISGEKWIFSQFVRSRRILPGAG